MHTLKLYTRGEILTISDVYIRETRNQDVGYYTVITFNTDGFNPDLTRLSGFFRTNGPVVETLVEEIGPLGTDMYSIGEKRIGGIKLANGIITLELRVK